MSFGAGQILTGVDIEQELLSLSQRLDKGVAHLDAVKGALDKAQMEYDFAFARALLRSEQTSEGKRKADALLACEQLRRDVVAAETVVFTTRERLRAIHAQVEITRSLGASVRVGMGNQP